LQALKFHKDLIEQFVFKFLPYQTKYNSRASTSSRIRIIFNSLFLIMKTGLLLLLLSIITTTGFTQIKRGQYLLGGDIQFESVKEDNSSNSSNTSNNFFISPSVGYFIVDKLAGGLRLDFSSYEYKSDYVDTHSTATSIAPFLRFYLLRTPKKVNAFIDVSYIHSKTKWRNLSGSAYYVKTKGYSISAGPSIFLSDQVALEFTVGYKHSISDDFGQTISGKLNSGFGLQIHFGRDNKTISLVKNTIIRIDRITGNFAQ